jgi:hypothetical protein
MNGFRYDAYQKARQRIRSWGFSPVEAELLQDSAEALLLARSLEDEDVDEITMTASVVIDQALASSRLGRVQANELRSRLAACGPPRATVLRASAPAAPQQRVPQRV